MKIGTDIATLICHAEERSIASKLTISTFNRLILLFTVFVENHYCWFCCHSDEGGISQVALVM